MGLRLGETLERIERSQREIEEKMAGLVRFEDGLRAGLEKDKELALFELEKEKMERCRDAMKEKGRADSERAYLRGRLEDVLREGKGQK